jgi:hypothetical protein
MKGSTLCGLPKKAALGGWFLTFVFGLPGGVFAQAPRPAKEELELLERERNRAKELELQLKWNKEGIAGEADRQRALEENRALNERRAVPPQAIRVELNDVFIDNNRLVVPQWQQGAFPSMTREAMRETFFRSLGGSEQAFKQQKREKFRRELDRLNSICELTPAQTKKVEEAIEVDMEQLHTQIEKIMSEFDSEMDINQFSKMQQDIRRLSTSGVTTVGSSVSSKDYFWLRVFHSQLTTEQKTLIEQDRLVVANNKTRTHHYRTLLGLQRKFGLTEAQRKATLEWISQENRQRVPFSEIEKQFLASPIAKMLTDEQRHVVRPPGNFRNF